MPIIPTPLLKNCNLAVKKSDKVYSVFTIYVFFNRYPIFR